MADFPFLGLVCAWSPWPLVSEVPALTVGYLVGRGSLFDTASVALSATASYCEDRKFDASTLMFPKQVRMAFANDALYAILQNNIAEATAILQLWVAASKEARVEGMSGSTAKGLESTVIFATAFLSVVSEEMTTSEGHKAYAIVFLP